MAIECFGFKRVDSIIYPYLSDFLYFYITSFFISIPFPLSKIERIEKRKGRIETPVSKLPIFFLPVPGHNYLQSSPKMTTLSITH